MSVWRGAWLASTHEPKSLIRGWAYFLTFFTIPALTGFAFAKGFAEVRRLGEGHPDAALWTVAGWAALVVVSEVVKQGAFYRGVLIWMRSWCHTETFLRANLLSAQMSSGGAEAGRPVASPGEAITNFRDDPHDIAQFADGVLDTVGAVMFAAVAGAVLGSTSPRAAAVILVPLVLVVFLVRIADGKIKLYRTQDRAAAADVSRMIGDVMSGATTIKVNGATGSVMNELEKLVTVRRKTAVRDGVLDETIYVASRGATSIALGLVLLVSADALVDGSFGIAELVLFVSYLSWMDFLPRMAGRMFARHKQGGVAIGRMTKLVANEDPANIMLPRDLPMDRASGRGDGVPELVVTRPQRQQLQRFEVKNFGSVYASGAGVRDVSFALERGSFTVLTGPIGSGKSTLLRSMLGLAFQPDVSGSVSWNGVEVEDRGAFFVPPNVSFLPQVPQLVSDSVVDNVTLGPATPEAIDTAMSLASIATDLAEMPEGLQTLIGPRGLRLSGGQRQRLATARALIHRPELVVLDDLSSALDVETEVELWSNLAAAGMTVLAVSHRSVALNRADQVLRLQGGKLV